ncbi:MAG TPA: hypothetical protein VNA15_03415 [Candidatus Angelobacter sp.]|nr:hypothetical protein [Candidatus Angelobacter sp.]
MKNHIILVLLFFTLILGLQSIAPAKASTPRILLLDLGSPEAAGALQLLNMSFVKVTASQFLTTNLNLFDVLFVGWSGSTNDPTPFNALQTRQADLASWVSSGHGIVALAEPNLSMFAWLPLSVTAIQENADLVSITNPSHPIMANLTDALLSNWIASYHNYYSTWNSAYQVLAKTPIHNLPLTLAANLGSGRIAITGQDPDWHLVYQGRPAAATLLRNMINWAGGASVGPLGEAGLSVNPIVTTVPKGSNFSSSVSITNAFNLYSFDIFVTFDQSLLTALPPTDTGNVLRTYCLKSLGCSGVSTSLTAGLGFVEAKESLIGMVPGFAGNGTLFTIGFTSAKGSTGTSAIHIATGSSGTGSGVIATGTGEQIQHFSIDGVFSDNGPDLFVSIVPNVQTLGQGGAAVSRVTLYSLNGLSGIVSLSLLGVPPGVSASLNQTAILLTGSSASTTMRIVVGSAATSGSFSINVVGTITPKASLTISRSASLELTIPPPMPDFSVSLSAPRINIPAGSSGRLSVTVTSISGFGAPVTLSLQGLPIFGEITTAFSIDPVTPPVGAAASSTLTIFVNQFASPDVMPLTITASSASITHTVSLTLAISTFSIQPPPPTPPFFTPTVTMQPGQSSTVFLDAVSINGFNGTVQLMTLFVPSTLTAILSTTSLSLSPGSVSPFTVTLQSSPAAMPATFSVFVAGIGGSTISVEPISVHITDFSIALASPEVSVPVTGSVSAGVFLASLNNFQGTVNLQATGAPAGVSVSIAPVFVTLSPGTTLSAQLTITATTLASAGTFDLSISAFAGSTAHTTKLTVHITDFSLGPSTSSLTMKSTQSASLNITVTATNGFSLPVNLTISGVPSGVTATITPSTVLPKGGVTTATLTLTVAKRPLLGTFTLVVTATSGSLSHSVAIVLTISK